MYVLLENNYSCRNRKGWPYKRHLNNSNPRGVKPSLVLKATTASGKIMRLLEKLWFYRLLIQQAKLKVKCLLQLVLTFILSFRNFVCWATRFINWKFIMTLLDKFCFLYRLIVLVI